MWLIYLVVGWLAISGIVWLVGRIIEIISTHKDNVDELKKITENLSSHRNVNIREIESKLEKLRKASFFERPPRNRIKYCQKLLSPYILDFIQRYSDKINTLKEALERQDIVYAEQLLKEIQREQSYAPAYCKQYDKSLFAYQTKIKELKSIETVFNNDIQRLQLLIDNGTKNDADDIGKRLHDLISSNPNYRRFDKQLLSQLENEVKIKWPNWESSNNFFDFLNGYGCEE